MPQAGFEGLGLLETKSLVLRTEFAVLKVCGITAAHRSVAILSIGKEKCKIVETKLNSTKNPFNENLLTDLANKYHSQQMPYAKRPFKK